MNAVDLIKKWEGCKLEAYQDEEGTWTIGYGSTGPGIVEGLTITQGTANAMLTSHIQEITHTIKDLVGIALNNNQMTAVISLVYNIGTGRFRKSKLLKCILQKDYKDAAFEFLSFRLINGIPSKGLENRRKEESALFLTPI